MPFIQGGHAKVSRIAFSSHLKIDADYRRLQDNLGGLTTLQFLTVAKVLLFVETAARLLLYLYIYSIYFQPYHWVAERWPRITRSPTNKNTKLQQKQNP